MPRKFLSLKTRGILAAFLLCFAASLTPANAATGLYGSPDGRLFHTVDNHIFISHDEGANWHLYATLDPLVYSLAVHPDDPNLVLAGTYEWVWRTTDNGETWVQMEGLEVVDNEEYGDSWNQINSIKFAGNNDLVYLAGVLRGVHVSADAGISWHDFDGFGSYPYSVSVSPIDSSTIYVLSEQGPVMRTFDAGQNWEPIAEDVAGPWAFAIDPSDDRYLVVSGLDNAGSNSKGNLYHSADSGDTWTKTTADMPDLLPIDVAFDSKAPLRVFAVTRTVPSFGLDGEWPVQVSTDGGLSWQQLPNAPKTSGIDMFISATSDTLVLLGYNGMWRSTDGGETWSEVDFDFAVDESTEDMGSDQDSTSGQEEEASRENGGGVLVWLTVLLASLRTRLRRG